MKTSIWTTFTVVFLCGFVTSVLGNGEAIADEVEIISAVEGGRAQVPCNISTYKPGDRVSLVLWYKGTAGIPIYSVDLRSKATANNTYSFKDVHARKVELMMTTTPAYLILRPVLPDDSGIFRCRVDFQKSPTRNQRVRLDVIEPPRYVRITDDANKEIGDVITLRDGDGLKLQCHTDSGRPPPSITWWRGSSLISNTQSIPDNGGERNIMTVTAVSRQDLQATYTCQASNNNFSLPASKTVTLDLTLKPLGVHIVPGEEPLSAHVSHQIKCQSYGSRPPPTISWWKGAKRLKQTQDLISDDRNVTTSILKFTPSEEDHGRLLVCRAENPLMFGSGIEDQWKMDVHYPPTATLALGSSLKEEFLKEGDDVYFECSIRANPRIYKVDWKFQGTYLGHNVSAGIIVSNQSLVLQKIKRTSTGTYTCVARNTEGDGESNQVVLKFKYAPYCKRGQKGIYGIAKHETAEITCDISSNPESAQFKWAFNTTSDLLDASRARFANENGRSVALYTPRTETDYGNLLCWAGNEVGEQKEPCIFSVVPAGPPDPPRNCSLLNLTETSVYVECLEGFDGGIEQTFLVEVFDAENYQVEFNFSRSKPDFRVEGLSPGRSFIFRVYGVNSRGRSPANNLAVNTLRVAERRTGLPSFFTITPILGVLIGIVAVLVVAAVIIVIVMKLRGPDGDRKSSDIDDVERTTVPLKKDMSDIEIGDEKNPDLIPSEDDHLYDDVDDEKSFAKLNNTSERIYENVPSSPDAPEYENLNNLRNNSGRPRSMEEVTYVELQLSNSYRGGRGVMRQMEPTVYAQIDHNRKAPPLVEQEEDDPSTAETPLMNNHRESTV